MGKGAAWGGALCGGSEPGGGSAGEEASTRGPQGTPSLTLMRSPVVKR